MLNDPSTIDTMSDVALGCLLGGAVGDALGSAIEFKSLNQIKVDYGPDGLTRMVDGFHGYGTITDDTQMSLFTLEGLFAGYFEGLHRGGFANVPPHIYASYLRWLYSQSYKHPLVLDYSFYGGWLMNQPGIMARRAPGQSCLSALQQSKIIGTMENRVNDSKGCGGVMRIAPIGLIAGMPFDLACKAAAITHGHPSGYLSAGFFAEVISFLVKGLPLENAIMIATDRLKMYEGCEGVLASIEKALFLAEQNDPSPETVEELGQGWVAEEAVAISLYCSLVAKDFSHGVLLAINHSGDSDSTGSMTGNLLGIMHGPDSIRPEWTSRLEVRETIKEMVDDISLSGIISSFESTVDINDPNISELSKKYSVECKHIDWSKLA